MADDDALNSEKNQEPLVSVLIPAYNHHEYIVECLESVRALNYRRLELIVSDDCSPDNTFKLAEQWVQKNADRFERTLVVRQDRNVGLVRNLQSLFHAAQGDYLAYIASDDLFLESAIAGRVAMLESNPDIDAVFGNAHNISTNGAMIRSEHISKRNARELLSSELLTSSILLRFPAPGPAMILRRGAVLENGSLGLLQTDLIAEDVYIYLRLAARGKLRYVNAVVAKYRMVPGDLGGSIPGRLRMEEYVKVYERIRPLLSGFNRFVLENRMARYKLELNKDKAAFYSVKVFILRIVLVLERTIVYSFALAESCRRNWGRI